MRPLPLPAALRQRLEGHAPVRAVARVEPVILESHHPAALLMRASLAVRLHGRGTTLRLVTLSRSQNIEEMIVDMGARQRAAPPELRPLATARRDWYRTALQHRYVPDLAHYLVLEAPSAPHLAKLQEETEADLGLDMRWLEGEERAVVDPPCALVRETPDYLVAADGTYWAARSLQRLPATVPVGWIKTLLTLEFPYRLEIVCEGRDVWSEHRRISDRITEIEQILQAVRDARMRSALEELEQLSREMDRALMTVVGLGVSMIVSAPTVDTLQDRLERVQSAIRTMAGATAVRVGRHDQGRLVRGDPPLYRTSARVAGAIYPWQKPAPGHASGFVMGEATGGALVRYDPRQAMTGTMLAAGVQGSGKSAFGQFVALQNLLEGYNELVIDRSGSWRDLVAAVGGLVVCVRDGSLRITPELVRAPAVLVDTAGAQKSDFGAVWELMQQRVAWAQARGSNCRVDIDEGWSVIRESGEAVEEVGRTARHGDIHAAMYTQNLSDALDDPNAVKFFTSIPWNVLFRCVDERIGFGAGLEWFDRIFGAGAGTRVSSLRRQPGQWTEAYIVERDITRSTLQRATIRVRPTPYDLWLFGSYRWERESRRAAIARYGDVISAALGEVG